MKIFSSRSCVLGESPFWSDVYQQFFWLDIGERKIYAKSLLSQKSDFDQSWSVDFIPTALVDNRENGQTIWIVADQGLYLFDPRDGVFQKRFAFQLENGFRTNDAGVDGQGNLWIGVMQNNPSGLNGYVFIMTTKGDIYQIIRGIGIPNTFCWSDELEAMLISDSFQRKTYAVKIDEKVSAISDHKAIIDLYDTKGTPDGGAIDENGNLWNANWGLARIICHDFKNVQDQLCVSAAQVTSVCFGGLNRDKLIVTSAKEGLSERQSKDYPNAGFTFLVNDLKVNGRVPLGFALKDTDNVS